MVRKLDSREVLGDNGCNYEKMNVKEAKRLVQWKGRYACPYCREVVLLAQKLRKAVMLQRHDNHWDAVAVVY